VPATTTPNSQRRELLKVMRVAFLYNCSSEDPGLVADDEIPARSPVVHALKQLGHRLISIPCTLDLAAVRRRLLRARPDVVFNRVESLGRSDSMMAAITLLLDAMEIPYTGNSSAALVATASKVYVKQRLHQAGLPTPEWIGGDRSWTARGDAKFILKSVYEHASFELDDASVVTVGSQEKISTLLGEREAATGRAYFAEGFVEGREFNLSLIGPGPRVLPPAEIDFSSFPRGKERIVGHSAKCDKTSFEYHNTDRLFDFAKSDQRLLQRLGQLAVESWWLFELCGYARVDFRVDSANQPWILEINTNPCTSPEAGFAAALNHAGIAYHDGIQAILEAALSTPAKVNGVKHPVFGVSPLA
jgi:D-alanine-D-alanine ligase